jgi:hypothetical protein
MAEASSVLLEEFRKLYPSYQHTDELLVQEGRDVMWGITYKRRGKQSCTNTGDRANAGDNSKPSPDA